jgi:hypothetical protein
MANCASKVAAKVTGRLGVPVEPLEHVDVADDVRRGMAARGRVLQQGGRVEGVVVVAVGVDHVAHGQVGDAAQFLDDPWAVGEEPGVHDGDTLRPHDQGRVAETGQEEDPRGDPTCLLGCPRLAECLGPCGLDGIGGAAHGIACLYSLTTEL